MSTSTKAFEQPHIGAMSNVPQASVIDGCVPPGLQWLGFNWTPLGRVAVANQLTVVLTEVRLVNAAVDRLGSGGTIMGFAGWTNPCLYVCMCTPPHRPT